MHSGSNAAATIRSASTMSHQWWCIHWNTYSIICVRSASIVTEMRWIGTCLRHRLRRHHYHLRHREMERRRPKRYRSRRVFAEELAGVVFPIDFSQSWLCDIFLLTIMWLDTFTIVLLLLSQTYRCTKAHTHTNQSDLACWPVICVAWTFLLCICFANVWVDSGQAVMTISPPVSALCRAYLMARNTIPFVINKAGVYWSLLMAFSVCATYDQSGWCVRCNHGCITSAPHNLEHCRLCRRSDSFIDYWSVKRGIMWTSLKTIVLPLDE